MKARAAGLVLLTAPLVGGCVYFNGMYNAKRLAGSAWKAEREGRTYEANNLWGQVATRAESVVVRHPNSKYVTEARVLRGLALARLGQCPAAVGPLAEAPLLTGNPTLSEEAALAQGRCQVELGNGAAAQLAFAPVLESKDPARRREAHFQYAKALRLNGRFDEALLHLNGISGARADEERLLSLAGAGRKHELLSLTDSVLSRSRTDSAVARPDSAVARRDSIRVWDSVLVTLGRADAAAASELLDHLRAKPEVGGPRLALLLLEDGIRLAPVDSARAGRRFREAARVGAGTETGDRAQLALVRLQLAGVREPSQLAPLQAALQPLVRRSGAAVPEALELSLSLQGVRAVADSTPAAAPLGDLRLFLAAETARDSLSAPLLAAGLFRRVAVDWPESPYAPKALLAGQQLDSTWADSARAILAEQYAGSPYVALTRGEDPAEFRVLEDSLQAFAAREPTVRPPAVSRPRPPGQHRRPGGRRLPDDSEDRPSRAGAPRQPQP